MCSRRAGGSRRESGEVRRRRLRAGWREGEREGEKEGGIVNEGEREWG